LKQYKKLQKAHLFNLRILSKPSPIGLGCHLTLNSIKTAPLHQHIKEPEMVFSEVTPRALALCLPFFPNSLSAMHTSPFGNWGECKKDRTILVSLAIVLTVL